MTHLSARAAVVAATCLALMSTGASHDAQAQCATCATPTVAYSPVVAAPVAAPTTVVVAPRLGLFDRWRLRRWGVPVVTASPAYTAAYAPAYTAGYAPAYTASYGPAYTAAYAPAPAYLTSYAPLQPVVQTSYSPVATIDSCSTCAQPSYAAYAPTAVLAPAAPACTTCAYGCTTCSVAAPCSSCSACGTDAAYVESAGYATTSSGCASCATGAGTIEYASPPTGYQAGSADPLTPRPGIPDEAAPSQSGYGNATDAGADGSNGSGIEDPGPVGDSGDTGAFNAPQLLRPDNDRTANRPTVDVHHAVYRRPVAGQRVSTTTARPVSTAVDATAWQSAPSGR